MSILFGLLEKKSLESSVKYRITYIFFSGLKLTVNNLIDGQTRIIYQTLIMNKQNLFSVIVLLRKFLSQNDVSLRLSCSAY